MMAYIPEKDLIAISWYYGDVGLYSLTDRKEVDCVKLDTKQ